MAGKCLLVSLLLAVTALCRGGTALDYLKDDEFHQWVSKYHKDGENLAEIYPTWRRNADFVKQHNSQDHSFTVALNKFAHLNVGNLVREKHLATRPSNVMPIDLAPADIPASVDWRLEGVVPPVIDQGECGHSSLFACVDSIDALWAIKNGHLELGSYEECTDCCLKGSCDGISYDIMWLYQCVVKLGGLALYNQYISPNHTCQSDKYPGVIKINGAAYVTPYGQELMLAKAVAEQPVVVAVDASHQSFQLYEEGIYYNSNCSSTRLDHSMLVVGYGTQNGKDYWIVKNSWGEYWGMEGYMLMARNRNNNCGIASEATYPYMY